MCYIYYSAQLDIRKLNMPAAGIKNDKIEIIENVESVAGSGFVPYRSKAANESAAVPEGNRMMIRLNYFRNLCAKCADTAQRMPPTAAVVF